MILQLNNVSLGRVKEHYWVVHTLAPFSHAPMSSNTNSALIALQPKSNGYFPFFLEKYKLD
jgi:hypothetical protein